MVPVSIGAKELGECVTVPATLMFLEKYFCVPGKILQPEPKRQAKESPRRMRSFEVDRKKAFIIKIQITKHCGVNSQYSHCQDRVLG